VADLLQKCEAPVAAAETDHERPSATEDRFQCGPDGDRVAGKSLAGRMKPETPLSATEGGPEGPCTALPAHRREAPFMRQGRAVESRARRPQAS
jgi:hypothetical protein